MVADLVEAPLNERALVTQPLCGAALREAQPGTGSKEG
jgi:hypothetical protein